MAIKFLNNGYFAGNVGIGTATPLEKLTVDGTDSYLAAQQTNYVWGGPVTIGAKLGTNSSSGILDMRRWTGTGTGHGTAAITQTNATGGWGLDFKLDAKSTNTVATTSRMFISLAGNVGIGTTSPTAKLHVAGTLATFNSKVYINASASIPNRTEEFQVTGKQIITNTGTNSPALYLGYNSSGTNSVELGRGRTANGSSYIDLNGEVMSAGDYGFRIMRRAGVNAITDLIQVGTGSLTINALNGADTVFTNTNVGIGTTSPGAKLEVAGDGIFNGSVVINNNIETLRLSTTEAGGGTYQTWHNAGGRKGFFGYAATVNDIIYLVNEENSTIQLGTNGRTADFTLSATGNIGLGITTPGVKLVTVTQNYSEGPTLGSAIVGGQAFLATNGLFGQYSGVSATTGHVWHQVQRNDTATAYNMILQPAGGNVGIGTTSPSHELTVQGSASPNIELKNTNYSDGGFVLNRSNYGQQWKWWAQSGLMYFGYSTDEVNYANNLAIKANGNVGIGTTSPGCELQVGNYGSAETPEIRLGGGTSSQIQLNTSNSSGAFAQVGFGSTQYASENTAGKIKYTHTSQTSPLSDVMSFRVNYSDKMFINGSGDVGIGTSIPYGKLDVAGNIRLQSANQIYFGAIGSIPYWNVGVDNTTNNNFEIAGVSYFSGDRDILLTPANNGNVGIGNAAPAAKLDIVNTTSTSSSGILKLKSTTQFSSAPGHMIDFIRSNNTIRGFIGMSQYGVTYSTSSDYRLKRNIVPIADSIDRIKKLKPSRFNWDDGPDDYVVDGFIAHEVADVIPEAITGEKDDVDKDNAPVYQSIDQSKIVPLLTAALQEAVAKIEALELRINKLEKQ